MLSTSDERTITQRSAEPASAGAAIDVVLTRVLDLAGSSIGLLVSSPLWVTIAGIIKLQDGGPVFYRARRVGKGGVPFYLLKFRTMVVDADKQGPGITTKGDARITPVGRWLRRTKLDELPQLLNVLRGDMALVGPRPEDPRYVARYTPSQRRILDAKPGITSAASLRYRDEENLLSGSDWETVYLNDVLPEKLRMDIGYLERRNVLTDVRLIWNTVIALFE